MKAIFLTIGLAFLLLITSCATNKQKEVVPWTGAQVFMSPHGIFHTETLEMRDGRFRYWFSSDTTAKIKIKGFFRSTRMEIGPKYPIQGTYEYKGDQLVLSNGKTFTVRLLNGNPSLWRPGAVASWEQNQTIDVYGILTPVGSIQSERPKMEALKPNEQ